MAGIDVSVSKELLPGLLGSPDELAKLVEAVLNQILEAQVTEALGVRNDTSGRKNLTLTSNLDNPISAEVRPFSTQSRRSLIHHVSDEPAFMLLFWMVLPMNSRGREWP